MLVFNLVLKNKIMLLTEKKKLIIVGALVLV